MPIEVFNGSSWVNVSDPEVYDGSNFVNIQKGEVYDGSSWKTFYNRFSGTINTPTITLNSRTVSTITVNVTLPTGSPYYTQVTVYRTDNALGASVIPSSPAVGAISGTKTETGLLVNTSYEFSAYATYYDSGGNILAISSTTTASFSTLNYAITTPTTPVLSTGGRGFTSLTFESTTNANYSTNGAAASITFSLDELQGFSWVNVQSKDVTLSNNDTNQTKQAAFVSLTSGNIYRCRARTNYGSPLNQSSSWSSYSSNTQTNYYTNVNTGLMASNNTTYLDSGGAAASSAYSGYPASRASDNNTTTEWLSEPNTYGTVGPLAKSVSGIGRSFGFAQYIPSSSFAGTPTLASVSSVTFLRYDPIRYWTATAFGTTYTVLYLTTDPPVGINNSINIFSISSTINGTRTIVNKDTYGGYYRLTVVTPGAPASGSESSPTSSASGYITVTTMSGGVAVSTLNKSLSTPHSATDVNYLYFLDSRSPNINADKSNGSITYYYSGTTPVGAGNETLYVYFDPKQGTYPNPRMIGGTNVLSVRNGNQARTITASLNGNSLGSLYFTANQTRSFSFSGTYNAAYDPFFAITGFMVQLTVPRVDTGFGWFASIVETQISYSYDVAAY